MAIFERLLAYYGPLGWWPAETPFEVCVGAILTQNTAWTNVEKAIENLKQAGVLNGEALREIDDGQLAQIIRPAGCYNLKSRRLKVFIDWLFEHHAGSLDQMFAGDWRVLRNELLQVRGIGPETCDSILLYAGGAPTFVVDSYTCRLFCRLGILSNRSGYDETRLLFMSRLPADPPLFNEYHALIVQQCKQFCRSRPLCDGCPLASVCRHKQVD